MLQPRAPLEHARVRRGVRRRVGLRSSRTVRDGAGLGRRRASASGRCASSSRTRCVRTRPSRRTSTCRPTANDAEVDAPRTTASPSAIPNVHDGRRRARTRGGRVRSTDPVAQAEEIAERVLALVAATPDGRLVENVRRPASVHRVPRHPHASSSALHTLDLQTRDRRAGRRCPPTSPRCASSCSLPLAEPARPPARRHRPRDDQCPWLRRRGPPRCRRSTRWRWRARRASWRRRAARCCTSRSASRRHRRRAARVQAAIARDRGGRLARATRTPPG